MILPPLRRLSVSAEVIFHLASSVGNKCCIEHPIEDAEINVIGTLCILGLAAAVTMDEGLPECIRWARTEVAS